MTSNPYQSIISLYANVANNLAFYLILIFKNYSLILTLIIKIGFEISAKKNLQ